MLGAPPKAKKKNFKQLKLPTEQAKKSSTPSAADAQAPGGPAETYYHNKLTEQMSTLEIGVEFKLDLRAEDLIALEDLGAGNSGQVSKVLHGPTKTVMAKKVIHIEAKPEVRKQILRELHIMHDCASPYIISFYGAYLNNDDINMCMEHMDCGSLDSISKREKISVDILGKITHAVVEGLTYLYSSHRIIHRDVKPSNILLNSSGQIKLCDFGVSGELINSVADTFVGTSTYMAPERIQGAAYSVKSDVWSLGITLLELAVGKFPFESSKGSGPMGILDLLQRIVNEPAPTLPKGRFPKELEDLISRCLIKAPASRSSPKELLEDPFIVNAKNKDVDLAAWAQSLQEKSKR